MKSMEQRPQKAIHSRRIAGHAQLDHILDPYQRQQKLEEGTVCPQCGAVFHEGRWQWAARPKTAEQELCPACRRINDKFPAGIVTLRGAFVRQHKAEILRLARHQEEAEKKEHPLNRIMSVEEDADGITINTTDIHLPRRIGETVKRTYRGELDAKFEEEGYFVRVDWSRAAVASDLGRLARVARGIRGGGNDRRKRPAVEDVVPDRTLAPPPSRRNRRKLLLPERRDDRGGGARAGRRRAGCAETAAHPSDGEWRYF
jgi:hypothetical protein